MKIGLNSMRWHALPSGCVPRENLGILFNLRDYHEGYNGEEALPTEISHKSFKSREEILEVHDGKRVTSMSSTRYLLS